MKKTGLYHFSHPEILSDEQIKARMNVFLRLSLFYRSQVNNLREATATRIHLTFGIVFIAQ